MRDGGLRRQPGLDQSCRRWSLGNAVGAGTAGMFGTTRDDNAELCRDDSSRSETSTPMQCRPPPQAQIKLPGSMISSIRGR